MRRFVLFLLGGVLILGAAGLFFIGPRNVIGLLRYDSRREGDYRVGQRAPDVALLALDGTTRVQLWERIGARPLVLVFGSFT